MCDTDYDILTEGVIIFFRMEGSHIYLEGS